VHGLFRSLANKDFRRFVTGHAASQMGTWMQRLSVIWAVFEITDSGIAVGVASACLFGPALFLSPLAGLAADRQDGKRLLVTTKIGLTAMAVLFTFVGFLHPSTPLPYYLTALLFGTIETFDIPVRMTYVADLVGRDDLANAVGLNVAVMNGSRVVGPTLAGILISGVGVEWCFAVNIGLSFAVLLSMLTIRSKPEPEDEPPFTGGTLIGFSIAWRNETLRYTLIAYTAVCVFTMAFPVTFPLFAERTLGGGPETFTLLFSALSLGSITGALVLARVGEPGLGFLGKAAVASAVTLAVLSASPTVVVALVLSLVVGGATMSFTAGALAVVQLNAPNGTRGRVLALVSMIGIGSRSIGGLIMGVVIDVINARIAIAIGALVALIVGAWMLTLSRFEATGEEQSAVHKTP